MVTVTSRSAGVRWHRHRIPAWLVPGGIGGSRAARSIAPQVRGRITPRVLDALERRGWHVHRIGAAAYVHAPGDEHHLIFGVWERRAGAPAWAHRLGAASAGYRRRLDRIAREQAWRRRARDARGRFAELLPWWRWPVPAAYRFEPAYDRGWAAAEAARVAQHNRRIRLARGLERADMREDALLRAYGLDPDELGPTAETVPGDWLPDTVADIARRRYVRDESDSPAVAPETELEARAAWGDR